MSDEQHTNVEDIASLVWAGQVQEVLGDKAAVYPQNCAIHDMERYLDTPKAFRASFVTASVAHFVDYVQKKSHLDKTEVFVDVDEGAAKAVLDLGTSEAPLWGRHVAKLRLEETTEFSKLKESANRFLSQEAFIDFIDDWFPQLHFGFDTEDFLDADMSVSARKALTLFRKVEVSKAAGVTSEVLSHAANNSAFDKETVSAQGAVPPDLMEFTCEMYKGFGQTAFSCRVTSKVDNNRVYFRYRILGLEDKIRAVGEDLKTYLDDGLNSYVHGIYCGGLSYQGQ